MLAGMLLAGLPLVAVVVVQAGRLRRLRKHCDVQMADLERLQDTCARLAPGDAVDQLATDSAAASNAERKEVTALFADLVGYTRLSEELDPPVLARILNGYFQRMSDAIGEYQGHVSTFIGDGLLAYFGALEPNPWQSDDAVHAALAMRKALEGYNRGLTEEGLPRIAFGIGIHRGMGLAGWVGSRERMEYAIVGRTVNVAARVQALTRAYDGVDVLVTSAVKVHLDPRFRLTRMPSASLKGLEAPVSTWAVVGLDAG